MAPSEELPESYHVVTLSQRNLTRPKIFLEKKKSLRSKLGTDNLQSVNPDKQKMNDEPLSDLWKFNCCSADAEPAALQDYLSWRRARPKFPKYIFIVTTYPSTALSKLVQILKQVKRLSKLVQILEQINNTLVKAGADSEENL